VDLNKIRHKWSLKQKNKQASIDMWNSMAESFGNFALPDFEKDSFLRLLAGQNMLSPNGMVLDVGCGAGKYALAIAGHCQYVTGVDLSPQMINIARQKAADYNVHNVDFYCDDWHHMDIEASGYLHKFDLVFAHMTPAIQSVDTFEKLSAASKGWCVLAKPIRRTDPVSDAVKEMVGIRERRESADEDILFAFNMLWQQEYLPRLAYEKQVWKMRKTLDEAYGLYINRIKTYKDISWAQEEEVREYIKSLARDGFIHEDVDTTIATLYWQVK